MTTFPTLPTGPFEHVSMDYARVRDGGLGRLGWLAGAQWTDFNTHLQTTGWVFQNDGNLVKYRSDGTVLWALSSNAGW